MQNNLYKIPVSWSIIRITDIANVKGGKRLPKGTKYSVIPTKYPYIRVTDFKDGTIDLSDIRYISEEVHKAIARYTISDKDIYISIAGTIGRVGRIPSQLSGANLTENAAKIALEGGINPDYLYLVLSSDITQQQMYDKTIATTQPKLALFRIESLSIPLPPLNEQKRIVTKIEALQKRSQRVKEAIDAIPQLLDQFRQSVLAAAFRGDLTADWREKAGIDFNKEWKSLTLQTLLSEPLANGRSVPDASKGFPVLRLTCLKNGRINLNERKIGAWTKKEAERFFVHKDDFLVSRGNGSLSLVGRGGLVDCIPDEVAYPDTLIKIRIRHEICSPKFLSLVWNSNVIREQVEASARTTAGIHKINQKSMKEFILPIPPVAEQKEIIRHVKSLLQAAETIEQQYQETKANLDLLNQSILAKAFRGELVPQNPNDEPASILLERIRAEREKLQQQTKAAKKSKGKITKRRSKKTPQKTEEPI